MDAHAHRQTAAARSRGRLTATLALTCGFLVVEVVGALWSGSLALLADAGHMLADAGGLALALFAIWIAGRPPTPAKTYGYYRAEILAALVNAVALLVVAARIRSEEHTSELQSLRHLVCRLLLEKKKKQKTEQNTKGATLHEAT